MPRYLPWVTGVLSEAAEAAVRRIRERECEQHIPTQGYLLGSALFLHWATAHCSKVIPAMEGQPVPVHWWQLLQRSALLDAVRSELHIEGTLFNFHPQPKQHDSSVLSENNTDAYVRAPGPIIKLLQIQDTLISFLEKKEKKISELSLLPSAFLIAWNSSRWCLINHGWKKKNGEGLE